MYTITLHFRRCLHACEPMRVDLSIEYAFECDSKSRIQNVRATRIVQTDAHGKKMGQ